MPLARIGLALWSLALVTAGTGAVGWDVIGATVTRTLPVLAFAALVTALAEFSKDAGVFTSWGEWISRSMRGRRPVVFVAVALMAVTATTFLSLDTTAVLLTPVVIAIAAHTGSSPVPFALATVWLANTASLTLPVSNLTNLLAQDKHELTPAQWLSEYGAVSLAAILVTCAVLWLLFRRDLSGRFEVAGAVHHPDRVTWWTAVVVLVIALPLFVTEIEPWITAGIASLVLGSVALARRVVRPKIAVRHIPWRVLVFASGLFAVAGIAEDLWLADAAASLGIDHGPTVAVAGAVGANLVNNLPAYLALEPFATTPFLGGALLIGVNFGPLITPWASLATLLWHRQLVRHEVDIPWLRYMLWGAVCVPLVMAASLVALAVV